MTPPELFRFCPRCGAAATPGANPFVCPACNLTYFFNPTVAAAAFIRRPDGHVLFIRRAKDPAKGMLAIPGGFIDVGETAEEALRRETREEVGLELDEVQYLGSHVNYYPYKGVTYPVADLVFTAAARDPDAAVPLDSVAGIEWTGLRDVDPAELAFASIRFGWRLLTDS